MATEKAPAFQFYPKDFLSDEKQAVMTCEQAGAYIRLLCHTWQEGSIPEDPVLCARLVGVPTSRFSARIWPALEPCFVPAGYGRLIHPRVEKEREKQIEFRAERSQSGKRGAASRWPPKINGSAYGSAIVQPLAKQHSSSSSSSAEVQEPPNPPLTRGAKLTRKERAEAEAIYRRSWGGWCKHDPKCVDWRSCVELIALAARERVSA